MSDPEKAKFRSHKVWKDFRARILKDVNYTCELSNTRYRPSQSRSLQVHHRRPEQYDLLQDQDFRVVNTTMHELIEYWDRRIKSKGFKLWPGFDNWLQLLGEYLTYEAIEKVRILKGGNVNKEDKSIDKELFGHE